MGCNVKQLVFIIFICVLFVTVSSAVFSEWGHNESTNSPETYALNESHDPATANYSVTFLEYGLPNGTVWSAYLGNMAKNSSGNAIVFYMGNGTYNFTINPADGFVPSPGSGLVTVNGVNVRMQIDFASNGYNVTFMEEGLPNGTVWNVSLNGSMKSSDTNQITFVKPNGTYYYVVGIIHNYTLSPFAGLFSVSGKSVTNYVIFARLYTVVFHETGLPRGTRWSVAFSGTNEVTFSNNVSLRVVNGSYPYTINIPENFTTSPTTGMISVNGSGVTKNILFSVYTITLTGLIYPKDASMYIEGQLVKTVAGVFTVTLSAGQSYELKVSSPGYETYTYNLTVTSRTSSTVLLNINLSPTSRPSGFTLSPLVIPLALLCAIAAGTVLYKTRNRGKR